MSIFSYADMGSAESLVPTAERLLRIECRTHSLIQSHHIIEKMNWIHLLKHFRVGKFLFNPQKNSCYEKCNNHWSILENLRY